MTACLIVCIFEAVLLGIGAILTIRKVDSLRDHADKNFRRGVERGRELEKQEAADRRRRREEKWARRHR